MMLDVDGSNHQWFQDERWHGPIAILDDATSAIYCAPARFCLRPAGLWMFWHYYRK